jgi:hypothetical protein
MSRVWCLKPCPGLLSVNINAYNLHFFFTYGVLVLLYYSFHLNNFLLCPDMIKCVQESQSSKEELSD